MGEVKARRLSDFLGNAYLFISPLTTPQSSDRPENTVLTNKEMAASCSDRRETLCACTSFLLGMMRNQRHGGEVGREDRGKNPTIEKKGRSHSFLQQGCHRIYLHSRHVWALKKPKDFHVGRIEKCRHLYIWI